MSESDPINLLHRQASGSASGLSADGTGSSYASSYSGPPKAVKKPVFFNRTELDMILRVYGQKVAAGEWRDYAIDQTGDEVVFSIFRRTSEMALYRVVKAPKDAKRQGAYRIIAASGMILKRGHDLAQVLKILQKKQLRLV